MLRDMQALAEIKLMTSYATTHFYSLETFKYQLLIPNQ